MDEQTLPHQCPHLGILDDPSTSHSFPSTWNACFHAKTPSVPSFEHQEAICLTDAYVSCPVYQAAKGTAFPVDLLNTVKPVKQPQVANLAFVYIGGAALLLVLVVGIFAAIAFRFPDRTGFAVPGLSAQETTIIATRTAMIEPTPTIVELTVTSTQTVSTTATPTLETPPVVLKPFPLDIPFKIGEQDFFIHRIKDGDGLDILAKTYHTTSEIIQVTNYGLKIPIQAGALMLIRPDVIRLDPSEPAFEVYMVTDKFITLDELAKRLSVDLTRLKYYNQCVDRCIANRDNWVLVPRHR